MYLWLLADYIMTTNTFTFTAVQVVCGFWSKNADSSFSLKQKSNKINNCKKTQFNRQRKGQTYKTAEIILLCQKVLSFFHTEPFTCELIAKRHSLSCHYKCDYY